MNSDEEEALWMPAAENLFGHLRRQPYQVSSYPVEHALEKALGTDIWTVWQNRPWSQDISMSDSHAERELQALLPLLAGPHGKTILKMYQIQKGLEHVE